MVSPNYLHRLSKVRKSESVGSHNKTDSEYHLRNIILKNPNNRLEQVHAHRQSRMRFRPSFSEYDRRATEDIRDDFPSERESGNDDIRQSVFKRYDGHHAQYIAPSNFYSSTESPGTLKSPPRVHRTRHSNCEIDNNKTIAPNVASFPVQAQSNRNIAPRRPNLSRIPLSLSDHEIIGDPSLNIHRFRLPRQFLPILDQIVDGCERHAQKLQNGWSTDLYSLTKQDIALREVADIYEIARPVTSYIYRITALVYGFQSMKVDHNQPHVLKYDDSHTGVELHHDKSDVTMNIMLSRSDSYGGGGTYFPDARKNVRLEFGDFLVHPGNAVHGGTPITHGSRYLMVIFAHEKK